MAGVKNIFGIFIAVPEEKGKSDRTEICLFPEIYVKQYNFVCVL